MQAIAESDSMLAIFNLGGEEIILVLALVLILFGAKKLPELARGLGDGIGKFRDAVDDAAKDAGRSAGGIHAKRAAQALTPDNQVAELYDHRIFEREPEPRKRRKRVRDVVSRLWRWILVRLL